MTSLKKIEANRLNARKSTGPRTEEGKQRSRCNALRHSLTAETVISALEDAADYQAFATNICADYLPRSATERELISRLASVLWRLRRSTSIETGLFQIQGELMKNRNPSGAGRRTIPRPQWYDELDVAPTLRGCSVESGEDGNTPREPKDSPEALAYCFLQSSRLQYGALDLLSRYETALWRQAAQLLFMLQPVGRK